MAAKRARLFCRPGTLVVWDVDDAEGAACAASIARAIAQRPTVYRRASVPNAEPALPRLDDVR